MAKNNVEVKSGDLEIKDLTFIYPPPKKLEVFTKMNLSVKEGEFVAIIGHNGSGKTTLSKLISGYLKPNSGSISIGGAEVIHIPPRVRPTVVGYVFQNPDHQVFKDTVWEDLIFGLENLGMPEEEIVPRATEVMNRLMLSKHEETHPFRLGKGDRQRVAFGGILVMNPKVLLVDEPTTGQDPEKAREIMRLLRDINRERNVTIIVVTHAMELVAEFCERVVVMGKGQILLDGHPREIFSQPEVLAQTFVRPPQICRLGLALDLAPLPLTVNELVQALEAK